MVAVTVAILTSLSACNLSDSGRTVYDISVDVPLSGWASTDTLFYSVCVDDVASLRHPIERGVDYQLSVSVRHVSRYPFMSIPFTLIQQQTDTTQGFEHPVRNILHQSVAPVIRDSLGHQLGASWGSFITVNVPVPDVSIRFDSAGTYRFLVIPDLGTLTSVTGLSALGLRLSE